MTSTGHTTVICLAALLVACGSDVNGSDGTTGSQSTDPSTGSTGGGTTTTSDVGGTGGMGAGGGGAGLPSGEVRIIAIGDTGEGNTEQYCVAQAMSQKCMNDGCDAVLMNGDNFYKESNGIIASNGGVDSIDDPIWDTAFELPYDQPGLNELPFYAVFGNHDYSPALLQQIIGSDGVMQAQIDYSSLPVGDGPGQRLSDKWHMPARWYDVDVGAKGILHIFGFDTVHAGELGDGNVQLDDMAARVAGSSLPWKIAFAHHPRFTSGNHASDNDFLNGITALSPPSMYQLQQAIYCNADIFMSGHDHDREYIPAGQDGGCPSTHFLISGAGAKVRDSGAAMVPASQYYNEDIEGFFYLVVTATELRIESYDMDPVDCPGAATAPVAWSTVLTH